jgi:hypothetical protein
MEQGIAQSEGWVNQGVPRDLGGGKAALPPRSRLLYEQLNLQEQPNAG